MNNFDVSVITQFAGCKSPPRIAFTVDFDVVR
jgi:hypothetical protein